MKSQNSTLSGLIGAAFGAVLFAGSAQAHECRALGQAQNEDMGQYWLCVGFAVEDGDRPRAGTRNNIDLIPLWVPGSEHHEAAAKSGEHADEPVDTRRGDTFDVRVKLVHLKGDYYDIPHDDETHRLLDDWFFLKQHGVGYSTPLANTRFVLPLFWLRPVDVVEHEGEVSVMYRTPYDFVTPFPGIYAWVVEGTMRRQGQAPIRFMEKFVSAQPRIPYGPEVVHDHDIDLTTLMGAPEGWFDSVRPANGGGHPHSVAGKVAHSSPTVSEIMKRVVSKKK